MNRCEYMNLNNPLYVTYHDEKWGGGRGMKFVGTTVVYSYLHAIGVINAHSAACDLA